jgi:hypothetical protein
VQARELDPLQAVGRFQYLETAREVLADPRAEVIAVVHNKKCRSVSDVLVGLGVGPSCSPVTTSATGTSAATTGFHDKHLTAQRL